MGINVLIVVLLTCVYFISEFQLLFNMLSWFGCDLYLWGIPGQTDLCFDSTNCLYFFFFKIL